MARYAIFVREYGSDHDVELMQVGSHPEAVAQGLRDKKLTLRRSIFEGGKRVIKVPKYIAVRIVDRGDQ
jgi:hypothetical protein